jgi:hypothetical protein
MFELIDRSEYERIILDMMPKNKGVHVSDWSGLEANNVIAIKTTLICRSVEHCRYTCEGNNTLEQVLRYAMSADVFCVDYSWCDQ